MCMCGLCKGTIAIESERGQKVYICSKCYKKLGYPTVIAGGA